MKEKIIEVLKKSTQWMPASVLKDKVGIKNMINLNIYMKDIEKTGAAVSRSRLECGQRYTDWRHKDNVSATDFVPKGRSIKKPKALPVDAIKVMEKNGTDITGFEMPTDKVCCNAAAVVAKTASSTVLELRGEIEKLRTDLISSAGLVDEIEKLRKDNRIYMKAVSDLEKIHGEFGLPHEYDGSESIISAIDDINTERLRAESETDNWLHLAMEFECKSIPELRVFINAAVDKLERAKTVKKPSQPRRPFSVTGLIGYHAGSDKVTLFLDRRLSARSVTLPAEKLAQLAEMAGG